MADPKLDRLKSNLQTSGLQNKDLPLFQVIRDLIDYVRQIQVSTNASISSTASSGASKLSTYLTAQNEVASLPNSRELLAGIGVSFDDSIVNQRTINAAGTTQWSVLTDGNVLEPELIFVNGDVIMVHIP